MYSFFIKISAFYTKIVAKLQIISVIFVTLHPKSINMRLEFQKNIASSQFTLPLMSIVAIILWLLLPITHVARFDGVENGFWGYIPSAITSGYVGKYVGMAFAALSVYFVAELTNTFVLLRISSRMLSSTLALFFGTILCLHNFQPAHIIAACSILSFFTLFSTYQMPMPMPTFMTYLLISIGSLVFPKLLLLVPVYWVIQVYLRSLSMRCWLASLFGIMIPYWFFFAISLYLTRGFDVFVNTCKEIVDFTLPNYTSLPLSDIFIFGFVVLFFVFGAINFFMTSYLDKTRTRILFKTIIMHGALMIVFIVLQAQYFHSFLPLLLIDAALVGGHFIALTYNRFSHLYCVAMLLILIELVVFQVLS